MLAEQPAALGPYMIVAPLGRGGMGVVYQGVHAESGVEAAVKTVFSADARRLACLRREIHALTRIDHPGVVRILEHGVQDGMPWYAMELMHGRTLRDFHHELWSGHYGRRPGTGPSPSPSPSTGSDGQTGPARSGSMTDAVPRTGPEPGSPPPPRPVELKGLPVAGGRLEEALSVFGRICRVLAYVHGEGIVHGDLKPSNIFLRDGDGWPVLVDFGLASEFGGGIGRERLDAGNPGAGTCGYIAPEQIRRELVDARSDIYALGCMLFELVTGDVPFRDEAPRVLEQHLNEQAPRPSSRVDELPSELEELILRLLRKEPRDRVGYADDIAATMEALGARSNGRSSRPPRPYLYRPAFTGRSEAFGELTPVLGGAQRAGGCVYVGGESGVGKTRFAVEVAHRLDARVVEVVTGECVPAGAAPLQPFRTLLQALTDRCWSLGESVAVKILGPRGRRLARFHAPLAEVPGFATLPELAPAPPDVTRRELFATLSGVLEEYARYSPLVLILDDLQWADELSLGFLRSLTAAGLREMGVLIIGTYRSDETSAALRLLLDAPGAIHLQLGRLVEGEVASMVGDMLALERPPRQFVRFLSSASEGNPFFVGEYLRAAVAQGVLKRDTGGDWRVGPREAKAVDFAAIPIPRSLRELVAARLAALSESARRFAEVASVLGRELDRDLLLELVGGEDEQDEVEAMETLEELLTRRVMEEPVAGRLRFLHDMIREGAYAAIAPAARRAWHLVAAEAIERRHREAPDLAQHFAELVHHFGQAGDLPRTCYYLEQAGEHAMATAAYRETAELFERALMLDAQLPDGQGVGRARRGRWERRIGKAHFALGDLAACERYTLRALANLGHPMPDSRVARAGRLLGQVGRQVTFLLGRDASGRVTGDAELTERHLEAALAASMMAERYYFSNDAVGLFTAAFLAANLAERAALGPKVSGPYAWLGYAAGSARMPGVAARYFERARELNRQARDTSGLVFAHLLESVYQLGFGRFDDAWSNVHRGLELVDALTDPQNYEILLTMQAHLEYYAGDFAASVRSFERMAESADARSNLQHATWALFAMARALIPLGRFEDAEQLLVAARDELEAVSDEASELIVAGQLAMVCLRLGKTDDAVHWADDTLTRIDRSAPTAVTVVDGYLGPAEVYLSRWEQAGANPPPHVAKQARRAVGNLQKLAFAFPMTAPTAGVARGRLSLLQGKDRRARKVLEKARVEAERLGMRFDSALAALHLGRALPAGDRRRGELLAVARDAMASLDCPYHRALIPINA